MFLFSYDHSGWLLSANKDNSWWTEDYQGIWREWRWSREDFRWNNIRCSIQPSTKVRLVWTSSYHSTGIGIILTPTDNGIFVKGFSKDNSIARDMNKISIGDKMCAINGNPIQNIVEAKQYLSMVIIILLYQTVVEFSTCFILPCNRCTLIGSCWFHRSYRASVRKRKKSYL